MGKKSWSVVDRPVVHDLRGNLTVVDGTRQVPFDIARVYYLYDVPSGSERAGHAHRQLQQLVIAASGSFSVELDDGRTRETVFLNRSHLGVLMGPMVWRVINNFSRSEEHTSELQSLMRNSYAVFRLKKKKKK